MKKIVLDKYVTRGNTDTVFKKYKMYSILVTWDCLLRFNNKKKAISVIKKLESDINEMLFDLNIITIEVYSFYRHNYLYLKKSLSNNFKNIDWQFDFIYSKINPKPFDIISQLLVIVDSLLDILQLLQKVSKRYNLHHQRKNYKSVEIRLKSIRNYFDNYDFENS